jgi:tripeptide aminopeptidase
MFPIDKDAAINRLMRFLAVAGVTGREAGIGKEIIASLKEAGIPARSIRFDDAHTRIPMPTETGNLIIDLPGRGALKAADRILFVTHMDTVPLCAGAKPERRKNRIVNAAKTALGGDNRSGCAVLVTLAAELLQHKLDHRPLTLLFTVREESGLWGARHLSPASLGRVTMGFNFDGRTAADIIVGAVGADRWEVEIFGRASHAGVAPERGISATMILAEALAAVRGGGWFGKVEKDGRSGTSNVGSVSGANGGPCGQATNVVTDYALVRGESRSHDAKFVKEITAAFRDAFTRAATGVTNSEGKAGRVKFKTRTDYHSFRMKETATVVKRAVAAVTAQGYTPNIRTANGGLDANWLVRHRVPTVTFGAGQNEPHTVDEWIDLAEFEAGCQLAIELATQV